ncbi:MAG: hypothetical protein AAGA48_20710 [Myxococcota bacterium]
MAWWDLSGGRGVIGDGPKNRLLNHLLGLAPAPPSTATWLASLRDVLVTRGLEPSVVLRLTGVDGTTIEAAGSAPELVEALSQWAHEADSLYQERWERQATWTELLATVEFVLGPGAGDFFGQPELGELASLDVVEVT